MTKSERFEVYSKLLRIYWENWPIKKDNDSFSITSRGFCWILLDFALDHYDLKFPINGLPELLKMAPKKYLGGYWYKKGLVRPRLWCLIRLFIKDFFNPKGWFWNKGKESMN